MPRALAIPICAFLMLVAPFARAQPAVDKLEKKLRRQPAVGKVPKAPAHLPPETGHLGIEIADEGEEGAGVRVTRVDKGEPADRAGMRLGDLITSIDGTAVDSTEAAGEVLALVGPGETATFEIERPEQDGSAEELSIDVELGKKPAARREGGTLGVRIERVTPDDQRVLNLPDARGALVVEVTPGSPAERADLPLDAIIVSFDGKPVDEPADLAEYLADAPAGKQIRLEFWFDGQLEEARVVLGKVADRRAEWKRPGPPPAAEAKDPYAKAADANKNDAKGHGKNDAKGSAADARIAELEARIAELERRLAALELAGKEAPEQIPEPAP